jgi:5-methylcytosine-specific restriction protein A
MAWQRTSGSSFPRPVRAAILRRDPHCRIRLEGCTTVSTEADHVVPTSEGGSHSVGNGQGACASCHAKRTQQQAARARARQRARLIRRPQRHPGLR